MAETNEVKNKESLGETAFDGTKRRNIFKLYPDAYKGMIAGIALMSVISLAFNIFLPIKKAHATENILSKTTVTVVENTDSSLIEAFNYVNNDGSKSVEYYKVRQDGDYIFLTHVVRSESGAWIELYREGETYAHHVNDSVNGDHWEIHISASDLRLACDVASAITGFLVSLAISSISASAGTIAGIVVDKILARECSKVENGVWMNLSVSGGVLSCGWL